MVAVDVDDELLCVAVMPAASPEEVEADGVGFEAAEALAVPAA